MEDTLELLYVRFGRNFLDEEILVIFGYNLSHTLEPRKRQKTDKRRKSIFLNILSELMLEPSSLERIAKNSRNKSTHIRNNPKAIIFIDNIKQ